MKYRVPYNEVHVNELWFKALIFPVARKRNAKIDTAYFSSTSNEEANKLTIPGHIVIVKPINYDTILKELGGSSEQ